MRNTLLIFIWLGWLTSVSAASNVIGDANGDGVVNRADAEAILQRAVSSIFLGNAETAVADVNGDGQINALDAILVLQAGGAQEEWIDLTGLECFARIQPGGVEVRFSFVDASKEIDQAVHVQLMDLGGTVLQKRDVALEESASGKAATVLFGLSGISGPMDLADYVVEVAGQLNGSAFRERRSLYQVTPRMAAHVFGPKTMIAGGRERIRVVAEDAASRGPIAGAPVEISLQHAAVPGWIPLYRGVTDDHGVSGVSLRMPPGLTGDAKLAVRIASVAGEEVLEQAVRLEEGFATLLSTDKPLYQPGQTIHIRTLTLRKPEMSPAAGREIAITVADSKGNKVFRQVKTVSDFGVASAEFTLATELNLGTYTISAALGDHEAQKQVTVKRYALPKFRIALDTDKPYYRPGAKVSGTVEANYFFGKPVSGATVTVAASKFDVGFTQFANISGTTDAAGNFSFTFTLPTHFVGQPLQQGEAFVQLEASVVDGAAHAEKINRSVPVASSDLVVLAVPESGRLISGVENRIYLLTTYPNHTPARAECAITIGGVAVGSITTSEAGIGVARFTPSGSSELILSVKAQDNQGNTADQSFTFALGQTPDSLLLRTDRTLYSVGDEVLVDIFAGALGGSVFLDVIKEGQTLFSRTLDLEGGRTSLVIPLSQDMSGTLSISAYRVTLRTDTVRDRKIIYVDPANELHLSYRPNKETYLPGEDASIRLRVSDGQDQPVAAAVGLNIVDESVFALQEMQPGMEKVYFYLEEQLRTPRYEIHGFEPETIIREPELDPLISLRDQALGLMFASAAGDESGMFEISSRSAENESLRTKLVHALWKDVGLLVDSLGDRIVSYDGDRAVPFFGAIMNEAIRNGKLTLEHARDPWGSLYRIEYERKTDYYRFQSAGPDQRWNTADDLTLSAHRWIVRDPWLRENPDWVLRDVRDFFDAVGPVALGPGAIPEAAVPPPSGADSSGKTGGNAETPYLRRYFPETLYSNPSVITGPDGVADLQVKMADSITSWRLTGLASSANGRLGSSTAAVRVFQEFFVDLDIPPILTRGDEVSVPVAIYNYLTEAQDIRLVIETADWFELIDASEKTVRIDANQVSAASFRIKTTKVGRHQLQVTAFGSARSDALVRQVEVAPDGSEVLLSHSGRLEGTVERSLSIPDDAIAGASKIFVKVYPGLFSQVVEGLDSLLRMPFGCFEQTSSVTYPNVLALHYMKTSGQVTPEVQMKAEGFISAGYQRLLSFEVQGGGFEWFGNAPAHNVLTTYGLMEFADMSKVWYVDPSVIRRTQEWLVGDQKGDGSWIPTQGGIAEGAIDRYRNDVLRTTAYVVWGLTSSGYSSPAVASGINYVKAQLSNPELKPETYTLALCAHALLHDPDDPSLPRLFQEFETRKQTQGDQVWWESVAPTITFSRGKGADVELTALLAQAYIRYGQHPDTAANALNYLIAAKDPQGNFGSTQATVLALKVFSMAASGITRAPNASVRITINGTEARQFDLNEDNQDLLFLVDLQEQTLTGENRVTVELDGTGSSLYQIVGRYYVPWKAVEAPVEEPISIDVSYDKTELTTRDTVRCTVNIANHRPAKAQMVVIDLGIPPGFIVLTEDLDPLVGLKFEKYQLAGRQAIFYLDELSREAPVEFSFRLSAKYPIRAMTPQSVVYEYYNPEVRSVAAPQQLAVSE